MAITINWGTSVINIPKADMTLIQLTPVEVRQLDLDSFRLTLKSLEDDEGGMGFQKTHDHNTTVDVGGITLARVINILEPYTVTFENDNYLVNLVGGNTNLADRVNPNLVSVRSSNSAGLIQQQEIQQASFGDMVHVDLVRGSPGTLYPQGTHASPVDNLDDAEIIANLRGFEKIHFSSDWTFDASTVISDFDLVGTGYERVVLTFENGAQLLGCQVFHAECTGALSGVVQFEDCRVIDLAGSVGNPSSTPVTFKNCIIKGSMTAPSDYTGQVTWLNCWGMPDDNDDPPVFDFGTADMDLQIRNFAGFLMIKNLTQATSDVRIFLNSGGITLDSTVDGGDIILTGIGKLVNNSTSVDSLDYEGLVNQKIINDLSFGGVVHVDAGSSNYIGMAGEPEVLGNEQFPVNNLADAITISDTLGVDKLHFVSDFTFPNGTSISGKILIGEGYQKTTFTFESGCVVALCQVEAATCTGNLTGVIGFTDCAIVDLGSIGLVPSSQTVIVERCFIEGTMSIPANYTGTLIVVDSWGRPDDSGYHAILDMNGGAFDLQMRNFSGYIGIKNCTQSASALQIFMNSGGVELYSTVTAGNFTLAGNGTIEDHSTSVTSLDTEALVNRPLISAAVWDETMADHLAAGSTGAKLNSGASGSVDYDTMAQYVWDRQLSLHTDAGSAGKKLSDGSVLDVGAIADAVWDEPLADHLTVGSMGKAMGDADSTNPPTQMAEAIWNALRADYQIAGSFGEGVRQVMGNVLGDVEGNVDGSVDSVTQNVVVGTNLDKVDYFIAAVDKASIVDDIFDEPAADHVTADTFGKKIAEAADVQAFVDGILNEPISGHTSVGTVGRRIDDTLEASDIPTIVNDIWDEPLADHLGTGSVGEALGIADATADPVAIAAAVWNSARSSYQAAGSFGEGIPKIIGDLLGDVKGNVDGSVDSVTENVTVGTNLDKSGYELTTNEQTSIASKVWDVDLTLHQTVDSTGEALEASDATADLQAIVDAILDEPLSSHLAIGSIGKAIEDADAVADPIATAQAVWDRSRSLHTAVGSFGEGVASVQGEVGAAASVTAPVTVGTITDKDGYDLQETVKDDIAGRVWDRSRASHQIADTFGEGTPKVLGSVGSVLANVTVGTMLDKVGYSLVTGDKSDIVDRVWDEPRSAHVQAGSFGEGTPQVIGDVLGRVSGAVGSVDDPVVVGTNQDKAGYSLSTVGMETIAGYVWDEPRTDHLIVGSFGEGTPKVFGAVGEVINPVTVGTLTDKTGFTLTTGDKADIANRVWDEPRGAHTQSGSYGEGTPKVIGNVDGNLGGNVLGNLLGTIESVNQPVLLATVDKVDLVDRIFDEPSASHVGSDSIGEAIKIARDISTNGVPIVTGSVNEVIQAVALKTADKSDIVDGVLDEDVTAHQTTDSVGEAIKQAAMIAINGVPKVTGDVEGNVLGTVASVVASVVASISDKTGFELTTAEKQNIADLVLNEPIDDHLGAGSLGEWLKNKLARKNDVMALMR